MVLGGWRSLKNSTVGFAEFEADEPDTERLNATAVITEPGIVAPAIGSAAVVPATPAGAAAEISAVVLPAAVTRAANAPGDNVAYAEAAP